MKRLAFSLSLALAAASPSYASHLPGHHNSDPVFPTPLPGETDFNGGIGFVSAIGPFAGREIIGTTFDVTYVSDGATPASDLIVQISMGVLDHGGQYHSVVFDLLGSDLGFGSGAGTFHGTLSTDAFNGIATQGFLPPYSNLHMIIGSVLPDGTGGQIDGVGYFVDSFINFHLTPIPAPGSVALLGTAGLVAMRRRR